jgi:hypothetical protein
MAYSRASTPRVPAIAYCQGTPLRDEIELRRPGGVAEATAACVDALTRRFGPEAVEGRMRAHLVAIEA